MRKQLDEAHELNNMSTYRNQYLDTPASAMPALTPAGHPLAGYDGISPTQEAEAEEIKAEPESLNLNDLGRQMVEKALERNNGNRKKAAQELGISDRTLYRRIKQYGLDKKEY